MTDMLWEPKELFGWLMKTLREDFALFPSEIYYLSPPVEALEDILMRRVVYRDTARRYIQVFASKGWVEAEIERFRSPDGHTPVIFINFNKEVVPSIVHPKALTTRMGPFGAGYVLRFRTKIAKGATIQMSRARELEALATLPILWRIFVPLEEKKVHFHCSGQAPFNVNLCWMSFWDGISLQYPFWEALELLGIIEWSDDGETIQFQMGAEEIEAALKKAPPLYEDPKEGGMKLLTKG